MLDWCVNTDDGTFLLKINNLSSTTARCSTLQIDKATLDKQRKEQRMKNILTESKKKIERKREIKEEIIERGS